MTRSPVAVVVTEVEVDVAPGNVAGTRWTAAIGTAAPYASGQVEREAVDVVQRGDRRGQSSQLRGRVRRAVRRNADVVRLARRLVDEHQLDGLRGGVVG